MVLAIRCNPLVCPGLIQAGENAWKKRRGADGEDVVLHVYGNFDMDFDRACALPATADVCPLGLLWGLPSR